MASILTLDGALGRDRADRGERCKCVYNKRTRKHVETCFVGRSRKTPTGWKFTKGGGDCRR